MKSIRRIIGVSFLLFLACSSLSLRQTLSSYDRAWPQWGRTMQHDGFIPNPLTWPLTLKWRVRTSAGVMPSILALDDLIFITTLDGKQQTCRLSDGKSIGNIRIRGGIPFTCAFCRDKLIILKRLGEGNLLCYDLQAGHIDWRKSIGPCFGEPLVNDGAIYIAANSGRLSCYEPSSGKELHTAWLKNPTRATPSLLHERIVLAGDQGHVEAFTPDLKPLWSLACAGSIRSTPALSGNSCYLTTTTGNLYAIDMQDGAVKWKKQLSGPLYQSAAVDDSLVVAGSTDHYIYGLRAEDGTLKWQFKIQAPISTDPIICGHSVIFGSMDKTLYALDKRTGEQIWSYTANARWRTNPIVHHDRLLCATEDDQLYCFGAP